MDITNRKIIAESKQINIVGFLRSLGYIPVRDSPTYALFHAPYRKDEHPSLKVSKTTNRWCDLSFMVSGDIIDLGKRLYHTEDMWEVIRHINSNMPASGILLTENDICKTEVSIGTFHNIETTLLVNPKLLSYLSSRCIDLEIARRYCVELHYTHKESRYYSIGFENVKHGFEARNEFFKGCIGPKDISWIQQKSDNPDCVIFEGFMDFLSYLTLCLTGEIFEFTREMDFIVLNSVSILRRAVPYLKKYDTVTCCFDNDDAGRQAVEMLAEVKDGIHDASDVYARYKDLNDFIRKKPYCP
jgi:hypothetical protein